MPEHVLVIVDEAYFEYATSAEYPDGLDYFDGVRPLGVLRTFSKIYSLAGIRIGYGVLPAPMVSALNKIREPFNVNTVAQVGAYYSLDDEAEVRRRRDENQEQKTYLYSCFDRLGVSYVPSETNFVYVHTERPVEVFEALLVPGSDRSGLRHRTRAPGRRRITRGHPQPPSRPSRPSSRSWVRSSADRLRGRAQ